MTTDADRRRLLQLARDAIVAKVHGRPVPVPPPGEIFDVRAGAFVTLHIDHELRGCIGHIGVDEPFRIVIPRCAIGASTEDPRFRAVTAGELPALDIELSLLGPFEPIAAPGDIVIGRDGLMVEKGWSRGLLLPQVATEREWNPEEFLAQTCHKAGLARDAWMRGATLWRFAAEVFGEAETGR